MSTLEYTKIDSFQITENIILPPSPCKIVSYYLQANLAPAFFFLSKHNKAKNKYLVLKENVVFKRKHNKGQEHF